MNNCYFFMNVSCVLIHKIHFIFQCFFYICDCEMGYWCIYYYFLGNTVWLLGDMVTDLEYCVKNGFEIFVAIHKRRFFVLDPRNMSVAMWSLTLPLKALKLTVDLDCKHAAVAHDSYVTVINLQNDGTQEPVTYHTGTGKATGFAYGSSDIVYIWPARDQWTPIHCLNTTDGAKGTCDCGNYAGTKAYRNPSGQYMVTLTTGLSPQSITKYKTNSGIQPCLEKITPNPDHGAYYGDYLWYSWDNSRIFTDTGKVLSALDLTHKGNLAVSTGNRLTWLVASPSGQHDLYGLERDIKWITVFK